MSWGGAKKIAAIRHAVIDRYGTICVICRETIDLRLRWPDPGSFTIDHVLPRALGGSDAIGNLRPAHKKCNEQKGSRIRRRPRRPSLDSSFFEQTHPETDPPRL
ncbi:HNH endonuclease [Trueperella pyogenes]